MKNLTPTLARLATTAGLVLVTLAVPAAAQSGNAEPTAPTSVPAEPGGSDWSVVEGVPGIDHLDSGGVLAADASGSAILVGFQGSPSKPAKDRPVAALAWHSADGSTWVPLELPGAMGAIPWSAAFGPGGYVVVGQDTKGRGRIWHSPDGTTWTDVGGKGIGKGGVYDVAASAAGFTAVGHAAKGKGAKARDIPTSWASADGVAWEAGPIADVKGDGHSYDVAAAPDGSLLATVAHAAYAGGPPSLAFYRSADGRSWESVNDSLIEDLTGLSFWRLANVGGQFHLQAGLKPRAEAIDGYLRTIDGVDWETVPQLLGLTGAFGQRGNGGIALGDSAVLVSDDGTTWASSVEEALAGSLTRSLAALPDGRVLAVGPVPGVEPGSVLYLGTPATDGMIGGANCVDAAVLGQLMKSGEAIFALPAPDRERIAGALAAYDPGDAGGPGSVSDYRDLLVKAIRSASGDSTMFFSLMANPGQLPACP